MSTQPKALKQAREALAEIAVLGTESPGCCRYEAAPGVESEGGEL